MKLTTAFCVGFLTILLPYLAISARAKQTQHNNARHIEEARNGRDARQERPSPYRGDSAKVQFIPFGPAASPATGGSCSLKEQWQARPVYPEDGGFERPPSREVLEAIRRERHQAVR